MDYRAKLDEVLSAMGVQVAADGTLPQVDSLEVMNLVSQLEEAVGLLIPGEELLSENFKTKDDIVALLARMGTAREGSPGEAER